jgi:ribosome assembly protein YihI (activator of Der GTPase)
MAKRRKKAESGVSKSSRASRGKTTGAPQQARASRSPRLEDVLRAAQLAEEAVSAAVRGSTKIDAQQLHPDERAVHLAVHGVRNEM